MFHNGKPFVKNFVADGTTATAGTLGHCQGAPSLGETLHHQFFWIGFSHVRRWFFSLMAITLASLYHVRRFSCFSNLEVAPLLYGAGRPSDAANEGWKTFSAATWNQICQICCVLHVRIHVQLVGIPWLLPGISCWAHKGTFCISCAFHGRHQYFTIHFNTKWSVFRHDGQACFRGSSKRSSSLVVWCLKAIWCWLSVGSSSMLFNQFIHCFAWSSHTVSGRQVFMVFFAPLSLDLENHAKRCSPSFICKPIRWHH